MSHILRKPVDSPLQEILTDASVQPQILGTQKKAPVIPPSTTFKLLAEAGIALLIAPSGDFILWDN